MVHVRAMRPEDTLPAAAIHIEGQPHTFLSSLGPAFVARLFNYTAQSPLGFGFVAVDGEQVVGFAVGTQSNAGLFRHVLTRHALPLTLALLRRAARHPSILPRLVETLRYPSAVRENADEAESLSRGVRGDWQGKGVGSLLWQAVNQAARVRGARFILTTVDEAHAVVNAWHRKRQHALVRTLTMYGRTMIVYRIPVEAEVPTGEMAVVGAQEGSPNA
jgi:GNAT superfamily N-acetyltransferase